MLIDKYRPRTFEEIYGLKRIKEKMKKYVELREMPNMIFYGKNGVGKTVMAEVIARDLGVMGTRNYLVINASEERGIETIRNKIINFARVLQTGDAPFKICLIDEADGITKPAQRALRKVMEQHTRTIRFILTANDPKAIQPALESRCEPSMFRAIHYRNLEQLLKDITKKEGRVLYDDIIIAIRQVTGGDARKAINILEGVLTLDEPTADDVYELMAIPREENVFKLIHTAMKGDLKALKLARDFDNHNQVIYTLFALASSGKIRGLSPKQHLEIINAIGIIPGSTAKQRLGAIVARILTRRLPKE